MTKIRSKKELAVLLSGLKGFERPKVRVEQYPSDGEIAAEVLFWAYQKGDLEGKRVLDLGCGTGILGLGAMLLGGDVYFIDIDGSVEPILEENLGILRQKVSDDAGFSTSLKGRFVQSDVSELKAGKGGMHGGVDTIIQNPPFGVKIRGADRPFLEKACELATVVYSFHKSESKGFVSKVAESKGFKVTHIWDFQWPLKASMEYHRKRIERIPVSCFRLERAS